MDRSRVRLKSSFLLANHINKPVKTTLQTLMNPKPSPLLGKTNTSTKRPAHQNEALSRCLHTPPRTRAYYQVLTAPQSFLNTAVSRTRTLVQILKYCKKTLIQPRITATHSLLLVHHV